ncbi:ComE operon protein 1 [Marinomonas spartinae]|uniref:ComE operon protein 1 n=1 Tax=Marinomonas spartinae TaxID=1792290 RepID=A0A1A8T8G2_9GAMM|nr:helix-hairpin-helix domain-containing protein [Marinomonas spartinae]SBS27268.1 ComE operon protein 1 [Marinomonas spartinae]SBS28964.1 ComE operon protein 1 [Marinomonas spartinae]
MITLSFLRTLLFRSILLLALSPMALFAATPLNINVATADQLAAVMSGVGEKKAQAIIDYRKEHGAFKSVDQLVKVKGIGEVLLERNKALLQVAIPSDAKSASSKQ